MACCAIAFFLVSQLLRPWRWLHTQFAGRHAHQNNAVAWSLANPHPASQPRALASTAALVLLAATLAAVTTIELARATPHPLCTHVDRGN